MSICGEIVDVDYFFICFAWLCVGAHFILEQKIVSGSRLSALPSFFHVSTVIILSLSYYKYNKCCVKNKTAKHDDFEKAVCGCLLFR